MATHSSTLAWKIPWLEEPGGRLRKSISCHLIHGPYSDLIIPQMSSRAVISPNPGSKLGRALHFKNTPHTRPI